MPATTSRLLLPYPTPDESPDVPRDVRALAEKLDSVVAIPDPGDLKFSARTGEHGNWIKADGRSLAAGVYPNLRAALIADGSPFGADAGNPKVPDMRTRVPVGAGTGYAQGAVGGAPTHVLTAAQMPGHTHPATSPQMDRIALGGNTYRAGAAAGSGANDYNPALLSIAIGSAGGNAAHNNMQPYAVGTWFIYGG